MPTPSIESNHDSNYVTRVRPSALEPVDADRERRRNHNERGQVVKGNTLGENRGAKVALTGPLKAIREGVQQATGGALAPEESRRVVGDALKLYVANRRALGSGKVPVLARVVRAAVNDSLAGFYTAKAALVGFATPEGQALVEMAHKCESRAERAMTTALAFAKAIAERPSAGPGYAPGFELDTEGEEVETE